MEFFRKHTRSAGAERSRGVYGGSYLFFCLRYALCGGRRKCVSGTFRYFGIDTPIDSTEGKKLFAALADEMLDKKQPALYNQGIMDFGAIQCTPQSPDCLFCPLADSCSALSTGRVTQLPVKQHKTKTTNRYFNYIYVRAGAHTYINKRTANDIWKNLFELPLIETPVALSEEEFLALPEFRSLIASGENPVIRLVCRV